MAMLASTPQFRPLPDPPWMPLCCSRHCLPYTRYTLLISTTCLASSASKFNGHQREGRQLAHFLKRADTVLGAHGCQEIQLELVRSKLHLWLKPSLHPVGNRRSERRRESFWRPSGTALLFKERELEPRKESASTRARGRWEQSSHQTSPHPGLCHF